MLKKAIFIVVVIVLLVIINNLVRSIYDIWSKQDLLNQAQKELTREEQKNQKLKAELSFVQTPKFIEEEARNKLFLVKPGEQQVLIPNKSTESSKKQEVQIPNWQKWLNLFF
ncbi:MAG: septum formation initiator family protein [Patescibacteria group bacterium]|nr:septum formation initiator family protein [Patescibacteria group bacterium]